MRVDPIVRGPPSPWLATATLTFHRPIRTAPCKRPGFVKRAARPSAPRRPAARAGTDGMNWLGSWTSSTRLYDLDVAVDFHPASLGGAELPDGAADRAGHDGGATQAPRVARGVCGRYGRQSHQPVA